MGQELVGWMTFELHQGKHKGYQVKAKGGTGNCYLIGIQRRKQINLKNYSTEMSHSKYWLGLILHLTQSLIKAFKESNDIFRTE